MGSPTGSLANGVSRFSRLFSDQVDADPAAARLLAGVDPEGEMVQAPAGAEVVGDVDQLVGRDREAEPGP